jgi:hypothetical protein
MGVMGRYQKFVALVCLVGMLSVWSDRAAAGTLLNGSAGLLTLQNGQPDIYSSGIQITYDKGTGALVASGYSYTLNGAYENDGVDVSNDNFFLTALVDGSGNLSAANLEVDFLGGQQFFLSDAPVSFGFGKGEMDFVFKQKSFSHSSPVPAAGTLLNVQLHTSPDFTGFGSSILPSSTIANYDSYSDTAVAAPAPKTVFLGLALFGIVGAGGLIRKLYRAFALSAE